MKGQRAVLEAANCHFNAEQWKSLDTLQGKRLVQVCVCVCVCVCVKTTLCVCVQGWRSHHAPYIAFYWHALTFTPVYNTTSVIIYKFHPGCDFSEEVLTVCVFTATPAIKYALLHDRGRRQVMIVCMESIEGRKYWFWLALKVISACEHLH